MHLQSSSILLRKESMVMENWNEKLINARQLNDKSERTQANYICTVQILTEHCGKTPDLITEEELQEYFLHRRNVSQWAPNTMKSCYAGCRFFFENVLNRDWHIFKIARAKAEHRMPTVLTISVCIICRSKVPVRPFKGKRARASLCA